MASLAYASTYPVLTIEASSQKVPQTRDQMEITFTAKALFDLSLDCRMAVQGNGVNVLQSQPADIVPVDQDGVTGTAIVEFPNDGYYRISAFVMTDDEAESASTSLYFRVDQGNVHTIPEQIYRSAVEGHFVADTKARAATHAHRHLDNLKANGLTIAVENWPHDDTNFPVENNLGLEMETEEDIYADQFLKTALTDPNYKDTIILNPTKIYPCYYAEITQTPDLTKYQNTSVTINFHARTTILADNQDAPIVQDTYRPVANVPFHIYSRMWVKDLCSGFTYMKTVRYSATTNREGKVALVVAYAPSNPVINPPVIKVVGITAGMDIRVGRCEFDHVNANGYDTPRYVPGTEDHPLLEVHYIEDPSNYDPWTIDTYHGYQIEEYQSGLDEGVIADFLLDLFDGVFYPENIPGCVVDSRPVDLPTPKLSEPILSYEDHVDTPIGNLRAHMRSTYYDDLCDFIQDWEGPGQPLEGKESDVNHLLKLHYLSCLQ